MGQVDNPSREVDISDQVALHRLLLQEQQPNVGDASNYQYH